MTPPTDEPERTGRRRFLLAAASAVPCALARAGAAPEANLDPYRKARIDWRQAQGETLLVAVTPASYFERLVALTPQFEALTGITVRYDKVPPGEIRSKAIAALSAGSAGYATAATDPMYYPLYVARRWVDRLDDYLGAAALTDSKWFAYDDVLRAWRDAASVGGTPYGIPYDGEVTLQVYRKDLYDERGIKPAATFAEYLRNARTLHAPSNVWGAAMRGYAGAGQNMYIYPSIFRSFGGRWLDDGRVRVNGPQAVAALDWYVHMQRHYAPAQVGEWNWPEITDAFARGQLGSYLDAHSSAAVLTDARSAVAGKIGYARWPKGPSGRRTASTWNWSFPVPAALPRRTKRATWLFITWATCEETQARTSWRGAGAAQRLGVNRLALWRNPEFIALMQRNGHNFVESVVESLEYDTDAEWRPRVPQWPQIGESMAAAVHAALAGEKSSRAALDEAQVRIDSVMKG